MNHARPDLSAADLERLAAAAERAVVQPDAVILAEGETRNAIFFLVEGAARVERNHAEYTIEVAQVGPGEVFGEMGFLEGLPASASVVAAAPCVVDIIDLSRIDALLATDPGFYGRFYQALARTLSRRLRETTDVSIAEYAWGGGTAVDVPARLGEGGLSGQWGGGSPLRDLPVPD